jgi:hypothetical protein
VRGRLAALEAEVREGRMLPALAAEEVLSLAGLSEAGSRADGNG